MTTTDRTLTALQIAYEHATYGVQYTSMTEERKRLLKKIIDAHAAVTVFGGMILAAINIELFMVFAGTTTIEFKTGIVIGMANVLVCTALAFGMFAMARPRLTWQKEVDRLAAVLEQAFPAEGFMRMPEEHHFLRSDFARAQATIEESLHTLDGMRLIFVEARKNLVERNPTSDDAETMRDFLAMTDDTARVKADLRKLERTVSRIWLSPTNKVVELRNLDVVKQCSDALRPFFRHLPLAMEWRLPDHKT